MILILLALLLLVPSIAFAAPAAVDTVPGWLDAVQQALAASNWKAIAALVLIAVVVGVRTLADRQGWKSISSGYGAMVTSVVLGVAMSISSGALAGTVSGFASFVQAVLNGIMLASSSSGAYSWWKTHTDAKKDV